MCGHVHLQVLAEARRGHWIFEGGMTCSCAVVSCLKWMLRIELRSLLTEVNILNCGAISATDYYFKFKFLA